jgi:hypothetical protein
MADHYGEDGWGWSDGSQSSPYNELEADGNWYRVWHHMDPEAWDKTLIPKTDWTNANITPTSTLDYFKNQNYKIDDVVAQVNKLWNVNLKVVGGAITDAGKATGTALPQTPPADGKKAAAPKAGALPSWVLPVAAVGLVGFALMKRNKG